MKTNKIEIQFSYNTHDYRYRAQIGPRHHRTLFEFCYRNGHNGPAWYFFSNPWDSRCEPTEIRGESFPIEFFDKFIRAKYMVETPGCTKFPEVVLSKSATKMLSKEWRVKQHEKEERDRKKRSLAR
jgi:hypothetical protein